MAPGPTTAIAAVVLTAFGLTGLHDRLYDSISGTFTSPVEPMELSVASSASEHAETLSQPFFDDSAGVSGQEVPEVAAEDVDAPMSDVPMSDVPMSDAPMSDAPMSDAPMSDAPKSDAPKSDAPKSDAPKSDAPMSDVPTGEFAVEVLAEESVVDDAVADTTSEGHHNFVFFAVSTLMLYLAVSIFLYRMRCMRLQTPLLSGTDTPAPVTGPFLPKVANAPPQQSAGDSDEGVPELEAEADEMAEAKADVARGDFGDLKACGKREASEHHAAVSHIASPMRRRRPSGAQ